MQTTPLIYDNLECAEADTREYLPEISLVHSESVVNGLRTEEPG